MDDRFLRGLTHAPAFGVAVAVFKIEDAQLCVLIDQPKWLSFAPWSLFTLPEAALEAGETIDACAVRLTKSLAKVQRPSPATVETRARGGKPAMNGAVTICYACVPRVIRWNVGESHRGWAPVTSLPRMIADYDVSVTHALATLARSPRDVATLIENPDFTLAELQAAMNDVRKLAGVKGLVDIRNLRRQLAGASWLLETGRMSSGAHRPAKLYRVGDPS